jgi:hypothetical protein
MKALKFVVAYVLLRSAADLADHWIQTDHQAKNKGWHNGDVEHRKSTGMVEATTVIEHTSAEGRKACAAHVASYVGTQAAALVVGSKVTGIKFNTKYIVAALAVSGVTHYVADRRAPLRKVAEATGKGNFVRMTDFGMNGAYCLDQAWHHTFETIAAVVASA